jgi:hypothetical protein
MDIPEIIDREEPMMKKARPAIAEESELDDGSSTSDNDMSVNGGFYTDRFLPQPQLRFSLDKPLKYQMHNCLRGRDGSKFGLRDAGIAWVSGQRSVDPMPLLRVMDDAQVILACNNERPSKSISRDPRVNGKRLVSTTIGLVESYCLGSIKADQLICRRELAKQHGCEYDSLGIQPPQYIMANAEECEQVLRDAAKTDKPWLIKPSASQRGRGIRFFVDSASLIKEIQDAGGCEKGSKGAFAGDLVQQYVTRPALLDVKFKFDVRSWLLIASVDPLILFYHDGFVRVARTAYEESSTNRFAHITNLKGQGAEGGKPDENDDDERQGGYIRSYTDASKELSRVFGLPKDFMTNQFRKKINRAQIFAALAQFARPVSKDMPKRKGFYHIFACDSVVDRDGGVHLLECNGFPAESQQNLVDGPKVWREMMALVLNLQLEPWRLMSDSTPPVDPKNPPLEYPRRGAWKNRPKVTGGDSFRAGHYAFGGWQLAFNELETPFSSVDVCTNFKDAVEGGIIDPTPAQPEPIQQNEAELLSESESEEAADTTVEEEGEEEDAN